MNYIEVKTKKEYISLIKEMINETLFLVNKSPDIYIYQSILLQLKDIKETIIDNDVIFEDNMLYDRYSLGAIAIKNFDCEYDLYGRKLQDSFGGAFDYHKMPEE